MNTWKRLALIAGSALFTLAFCAAMYAAYWAVSQPG